MGRVVFVCAGNICRSPTAERVFRARAPRAGLDVPCASFGLVARGGEPPIQETVKAALALGVDVSDHRSRRFSAEALLPGDLVLVMERAQRDVVLAHRRADIEVALLGAYAIGVRDEIDDPGEKPWVEFERCMREIGAAVDGLIAALTADPRRGRDAPRRQ